jgi:hypothetical protein
LLTTWENRWLSRRSPPPESSDEASPTVHRDLLRLRYGAGPQSDELDLIESQIDSISTPRRRERRN